MSSHRESGRGYYEGSICFKEPPPFLTYKQSRPSWANCFSGFLLYFRAISSKHSQWRQGRSKPRSGAVQGRSQLGWPTQPSRVSSARLLCCKNEERVLKQKGVLGWAITGVRGPLRKLRGPDMEPQSNASHRLPKHTSLSASSRLTSAGRVSTSGQGEVQAKDLAAQPRPRGGGIGPKSQTAQPA